MTNEQYLQMKEAINKQFETQLGSEAHKKALNSLRQRKAREKRKAKAEKKDVFAGTIPAKIPYSEDDISQFTDPIEQAVVKAYLEDIRKTRKQIAKEVGNGISFQHINHILDKPEVVELARRLCREDISLGVEIAIRDGVAKKDPSWIKIAHDYGYVTKKDGSGCEVCHPEPMELDALTQKSLKQLGDWLADPTQAALVLTK